MPSVNQFSLGANGVLHFNIGYELQSPALGIFFIAYGNKNQTMKENS